MDPQTETSCCELYMANAKLISLKAMKSYTDSVLHPHYLECYIKDFK
jgi:hypothetical protein